MKALVKANTPKKVLCIDVHCAAPVILIPLERGSGDNGCVW
jgi:hypothetical protein